MSKFEPGQRVRFTKGPLGAIEPGTSWFTGYLAQAGDEGVVSEHKMPGDNDGWVYVEIQRDGQTFYVPVGPSMIEVVA